VTKILTSTLKKKVMSKKVCLLGDSLASGGAEKMIANLSKSIARKGYDVTIVIMQDDVAYDYEGRLYNFGQIKANYTLFSGFMALKNFFKTENFDIIFDHRIRNIWLKEFILSKFIFSNFKVVYCVHHFEIWMYFPQFSIPFLSKLTLVKNREFVSVSIVISQQIQSKLKLDSKVIYNYPELPKSFTEIDVDFEYIIAIGRLEVIKQFDILIDCYNASVLKENDIKLLIFGDGSKHDELQEQISRLELCSHIYLKGFATNVSDYLVNAKGLVMTSKSEGFPMVLIEAISLKTPVVSFNFASGPSEIISQNNNGILVKNQDKLEMITVLNKLVDNDFYSDLKKRLNNYDFPFKKENIIQQWIDIIEK